MKIAILYICTGRYAQFFHDFYQSAKQYFLTDEDKTFFVFTDQVLPEKSNDIRVFHKHVKGFPWTLYCVLTTSFLYRMS